MRLPTASFLSALSLGGRIADAAGLAAFGNALWVLGWRYRAGPPGD